MENRATLGAGLVSLSGVLVLGVLTLDCRITVKSLNRIPRKGIRNDATPVYWRKPSGRSASYVGLGPPRVTRTPRDTFPTELTPDTGLSHWWALPLVLPHTPRLGGDRLGFF